MRPPPPSIFSCICFQGGGDFKSNKTNEYEKDNERVGELENREIRERGLEKDREKKRQK